MKRLATALLFALLPLAAKSAKAQDYSNIPPPPPPPDEEDAQAQNYEPQPPPAPIDEQAPAAAPTQQTFEQQLSPYGRWVDTPEYGRVWVPGNVPPDWQPYSDGRWVSTSAGWTFVATAPWGPYVFHYGRWGWRAGFGWSWIPGYRWAPAWVSWRWVNGYACWAPLGPPGYRYPRRWPGWVVVPHAHFTAPIHRWAVPRAQVGVIVRSARPVRSFPTHHMRAFRATRPHAGHGRRR